MINIPIRLVLDDVLEALARKTDELATADLVREGRHAPEHLVHALLDRLKQQFGGDVDVRTLVEEDVSFELPKSVKRLTVLR